MRIDSAGVDFIKSVEGHKNNVYLDVAGLPTIGVGHLLTQSELASGTVDIHGKDYTYSKGLSDTQVNELLIQDLLFTELAVNSAVSVDLTQNQYNALVSFVFNVGVGAFRKSTLLDILNQEDYDGVPKQLKRFVYSAGKKIPGLVNRRAREIELWNSKY